MNQYKPTERWCDISLNQGKLTKIDSRDIERVKQYHWYYTSLGYVSAHPRGQNVIYLHRLIMNAPKNKQVDHINGDKLDNRRFNLRLCTAKQNKANQKKRGTTSQFKGVYWSTNHHKWRANIQCENKRVNLGVFDKEIHAAMCYDIWAKDIFGEFARLNFN